MFIARRFEKAPARFGGAELNLASTNPVSFRPSEPRLVLFGFWSINISLLLSDHEKDVAEFEMESKSGTDAEVKAFAARTLPTLKIHLRLARAIAQKVK